MDSSTPPTRALSVAVVGAGAAGLVAARELRREGHDVVVFERGRGVGGVWIYTSAVESDPLGVDHGRQIVHSSLYASLRVNLPREVMGFLDYPFVPRNGGAGEEDARRFPGHREVCKYLEGFARYFDLYGMIRFETEVVKVEMDDAKRWAVTSRASGVGGGGEIREVYDSVVVCVGNFWQPSVAEIPGIQTWPGDQIHSHSYRVPEPYKDKVVVVIGSSFSAIDISRDVSRSAKEVYIAMRSAHKLPDNRLIRLAPDGGPTKQPGYDNLWTRSMIKTAHEDGTLEFQNGGSVLVDAIIHCTGYLYHYPFLETNGIVSVYDNRVGPLYKHIFPPSLAPGLSFIGIPTKSLFVFPTFELQSKWVAGVLSGRLALPSQEEMMEDVKAFYSELEASGKPTRYTHDVACQDGSYPNMLATKVGHPGIEEWRLQMAVASVRNMHFVRPESFSDEWDDFDLIGQAHDDFRRLGCGSV